MARHHGACHSTWRVTGRVRTDAWIAHRFCIDSHPLRRTAPTRPEISSALGWQPTDPSRSHLATHRAHLATHRSLQIPTLHTCGPCATPLVAALPCCQPRWSCRPLRAGRCTRCAQYARRQPLRRSWCGCLSKRCPSRLPGMLSTPFLLLAGMLALPALPPLLPTPLG